MTMEIVAHYLQNQATLRSDADRDFFGRTAFNRYYYATFLDVKRILGSFRAEWGKIAHSDVPSLLKGAIQEELKRGRKRAMKTQDADTIEMCNRAIAAVLDLASLMEEGYATRVTADYTPDVLIDFSTLHNFKLNSVFVKNAALWPNRGRFFAATIASAWKQIHV